MADTLKVAREDAVKLFAELDYPAAAKWSKKRLQEKLTGLDELVDEDTETETKESQKLMESVLKAIEDKTTIELEFGEESGKDDGEEEKESKGKGGKGKGKEKESKGGKQPKGEKGKGGSSKGKKEKKESGPGVIASIIEFLKGATKTKPLTKKQLVELLAKRFPDRTAEAMEKTVNVQVPNRLRVDKDIEVESKDTDDGKAYWIQTK